MRSIHEISVNATKNVAACAGGTSGEGRFGYLKRTSIASVPDMQHRRLNREQAA